MRPQCALCDKGDMGQGNFYHLEGMLEIVLNCGTCLYYTKVDFRCLCVGLLKPDPSATPVSS